MYKLLIVDDEYQARSGLRDLVDWQTLDITVVGDAEDGDEALKLVHDLHPDILLTDVRMNRMDGLTLAKEAREALPGLAIVFISGYSDADYLRDALRVEAYDYLYKPVRIPELAELMRRLTARLDARAQVQSQMERARLLLESSRPLLIERFVQSWIAGMLCDESEIRSRMALLELSVPLANGMAAAVFQPEWPAFPSGGQAEAYLVLLEGLVRERFPGALLCARETEVVALVPCLDTAGMAGLTEGFQDILEKMRGMTEAVLLIGVSRWYADWADVPGAVCEAQRTIERHALQNAVAVLCYDETEPPAQAHDPCGEDLIGRYLFTGNFDALWRGIEESLACLNAGPKDAERARKMLMACALRADLALEERGLNGFDAPGFLKQALAHRGVAPVAGALKKALKDACQAILDRQGGAFSPAVAQVMEMIRTRYAQRLSVDMLADEAHYSPAHLSTLFRQETGMTIGDMLLRTRLNAAMTLLRTTRDSVFTIAQQAGYTDVQYFSRVFKRFSGMTPVEYRKRGHTC